ncbi:hypothetical protein ABW19_dt0200397 [Dactylella cylindrospora]|nr:hypothetical protein ABW19_dt0200397 [Dactylella cylindrospora]
MLLSILLLLPFIAKVPSLRIPKIFSGRIFESATATGPESPAAINGKPFISHHSDESQYEILASRSIIKLDSSGSSLNTRESEDVTETDEKEFIAEGEQSTEPGIVPAYMAGGYFVAELNIGEQLLFLRIDTGSFHFWVLSNESPELCTSALQAGSGCYTANPTATPLPEASPYSFKYGDGTKAQGTQVVLDSVAAAAIFGSASWASQVVAMPATVTPWDGSSGVSGVLPLGLDMKAYLDSITEGANSTDDAVDELPLDITDWHFFTTYFKPGSQMFIGFNYDPVNLYTGSWIQVSVAAINGSWFVQPDSTWATPTHASGSASAAVTDTPASTASELWSSTLTTEVSESPAASDASSAEDTTATAGTAESSTVTETSTVSASDTLSQVALAALPTAGSTVNSDSEGITLKRDTELPILLDTGSVETLLHADTVKSIYDSISGSCVTLDGALTNCTYPCTLNYTSLAVTPEYPATIELPWGSATITLDLSQFSTEIYRSCHADSGASDCEATCRGSIQPQDAGANHHVYGTIVYKSALFKWDTSDNGTVSMAPYASRGGESWFYEG